MKLLKHMLNYVTSLRALKLAALSVLVGIITTYFYNLFFKKDDKKDEGQNQPVKKEEAASSEHKTNRKKDILHKAFLIIILCIIVLVSDGIREYINNPPQETDTPSGGGNSETSDFPGVGEIVVFGAYKQNKIGEGEYSTDPIQWIVLTRDDEKALLLAKPGLTYLPISEDLLGKVLSWNESSLYSWLANDFCANRLYSKGGAFTEDERNAILTDEDGRFMVSLLSKQDANKYLSDSEELVCKPTEYAGHICENNPPTRLGQNPTPNYNGDHWWLCDPGSDEYAYKTVDNKGNIKENGTRYTYYGIMVRPTIWISIENFLKIEN